jgi:hypothetical protein
MFAGDTNESYRYFFWRLTVNYLDIFRDVLIRLESVFSLWLFTLNNIDFIPTNKLQIV